jgi:fermentation-respiration switch protein FrsA (DUF1100 family)
MGKRPMKLLLTLAAGALVLLLLVWIAQRRLIYFPTRDVPSPRSLGLKEVVDARFTAEDGVALHGWFAPAWEPPRRLAVLVAHGNGGNVAHRAHLLRDLPRLGLDVLVFDYRGYGLSADADPTEEGLYRDGRAALAWLRERTELPVSRVVLYGESLGSGVAVELAHELLPETPAALVLQSPFTSLPDAAAAVWPFLPVRLMLRDRYDSAAKIAALRAPLLIVHGTRDSTVPVAQGRALCAAATSSKRMIEVKNRDHNDLWEDERARTAELKDFLEEFVPAQAATAPR